MLIKLGILLAGILLLGGMIFSNQIYDLLPIPLTTMLDSLKNDIDIFGSQALAFVEQRTDLSIDKIVNNTTKPMYDEINQTGGKVTNEISNLNPIESIQNIFSGN